ncbi:hypothetical protein QF034_002733 [Streptomyces africanus]|uniref:Uncharacterized protein n=1 Tax=Streptomyces africanus TaxID=231024 RepID=A0ABU0QM90_9ACTN|nr:hypothetical protein [Streptomyces africanus]MDQ0748502.1 hypothetical protein [Streptomyces africanus]
MTARNDDDRRDADYDGMDALMAALVDDPLPEGARRDPAFMTAHRAATADVALLREQLLLMGDTLAHDTAWDVAGPEAGARTRPEAGGPAGPAPAAGSAGAAARVRLGGRGAVADASPEAGGRHADGPGGAAGPSSEAVDPPGRAPATGPADGARVVHADGPGAGGDPSVRVLPVGSRAHGGLSRRRSRPRALDVVLRGLVAAAAATVVVGMGWLVVQGDHGSGADSDSGSTADAAAGAPRGEEGAKLSHAGYLACARLVAEGTVAGVEPVPGTGQDRVTLDVDRSYKPAKGLDRIVFPLDEDVDPLLRPGDHVLVGITRGQAQPDLWSVGEKEIARARAWITAALPESATLPCE